MKKLISLILATSITMTSALTLTTMFANADETPEEIFTTGYYEETTFDETTTEEYEEIVIGDSTGALTCGDYQYKLDSKSYAHIIKYTGKDVYLFIPKELDGHKVVDISVYAFSYCHSLEYVEIPETVQHISYWAFGECENLKKIFVPSSVTKILDNAIGYSFNLDENGNAIKLEDVTIGCESGSKAFYYATTNGINYVILDIYVKGDMNGDATLDIVDVAMARAYIVGNITLFPKQFFSGDMNDDGEIDIIDIALMRNTIITGEYINFDETTGEETTAEETTGEETFCYEDYAYRLDEDNNAHIVFYFGNDKDVSIPATAIGKKVVGIDERAFAEKDMETLEIPDSVVDLGAFAFEGCTNLKSVNIPEGVTHLFYAFLDCQSLENVVLPDSIEWISNAFSGCTNLETVKLSKNLEIIYYYSFYNCQNLKEIEIPESVKEIYDDAFYCCSKLNEITIPKSVEYIAEYAIGYDNGREKIDNFVIKCYAGTAGEQYAIDNGFDYVLVD